MEKPLLLFVTCCLAMASNIVCAQYVDTKKVDAATKLYLAKPGYHTPYGETSPEEVKAAIDRVLYYLEEATPTGVIDKNTKEEISNYKKIDENSIIRQGTFSITNYMWGVTYSSMLSAAKITGDERYNKYVEDRFQFLSEVAPHFAPFLPEDNKKADPQMRQLLRPEALDDAGAMCSAMIKAKMEDMEFDGEEIMDRYFDYIMNKEYRLPDGTFARNRPQKKHPLVR